MAIGPTLETQRLILRPPQREDFDAWAAFMADEDATRYIGGVQSRSMAWRGLMSMAGAWALEGFSMFSVIEKSTGHWLGRLGPWMPADWPGTEVGWGLQREAQGKGYAYEGAVATIDWAFAHLGWSEVIHCIDTANEPSRRLAQRLGSTLRGLGKLPAPHDHLAVEIWGQSREQWQAARANKG